MKSVKLNYDEYVISDEAYEQIAAIVKANRLCELCGNPYTPDNPNVELNRCLKCFLRYHENQGFTYIKLYEVNQYGDETHWFLDPLNIVSYTKTSSKEPQKSDHYTLLYWGFPVPQTWQDNNTTKQVIHYHWSIYGDVKHDPVVLIHNTIDYGSTRFFDFLSYRDGRTVQIDPKRGEGWRLFRLARQRVGRDHHHSDSYVMRKAVQAIALEEYEQKQKGEKAKH